MTIHSSHTKVHLLMAACFFALAGLVWALTRSQEAGSETIAADEMSWVICTACGRSEQIPTRELIERQQRVLQEARSTFVRPLLICPACGQRAVTRALQCPQCQTVFAEGAVTGDYHDRCPQCGFSRVAGRSRTP